MLMNPRTAGSMRLETAQVIPGELAEVIGEAARDALNGSFFICLRNGYVDNGESIIDPAALEDFAHIKRLVSKTIYGKDDWLRLDIVDGCPTLEWQGVHGEDRAKRIKFRWGEYPGRAHVSYIAARAIQVSLVILVAIMTGTWFVVHPNELATMPVDIFVLTAAIVGVAVFVWMVERKNSVFISCRARKKPFVSKRAISPWRDLKFAIASGIAILAAGGAITTAIVNLLVHI